MSIPRWAVAAGLLAALAAGAPAHPHESRAPKPNDHDELLLRVEPPPAEPPAVTLSTHDSSASGGPQRRRGILYRAEWLRHGELWRAPIPAQVDWGIALEVSHAAALRLDIATTSRPSALTVYGFTSDSRVNGEPVGPPKYEIDCNRDDLVRATPKCELTRVAESLQLALVDLPPGIVRIAASIAWLETGSTSTGQRVLYDTGTWLFSLKTR